MELWKKLFGAEKIPTPPKPQLIPMPAATSQASSRIDLAAQLMQQGKAAQALDQIINPLIAEFEEKYGASKQRVYCANGSMETLMYLAKAASDKEPNGAITASADYAGAYYLKGYLAVEQKDGGQALKNLGKAVALSPFNPQFLCELGNFYQNSKDWNKAIDLYEQAMRNLVMETHGGDTFLQRRALRGKAFSLVELKRFDEAEILYRRCLEMSPNDTIALRELGYIAHLESTKKEPSINSIFQLSSADPNELIRCGKLASDKQSWSEALANFDRALEINPNLAEGWFRRGLALIGTQQFAEAVKSFDNANKLGHKDSEKLLNYWRAKLRI